MLIISVIVMGQVFQGQGQGQVQGQGQGQSQHLMPHKMTQILMCHCGHLLIVVSQVVLMKVTVHQTLRLCRLGVRVEYGG